MIQDQDDHEDRQFAITVLAFEAENNLVPEAKHCLGGLLNTGSSNTSNNFA